MIRVSRQLDEGGAVSTGMPLGPTWAQAAKGYARAGAWKAGSWALTAAAGMIITKLVSTALGEAFKPITNFLNKFHFKDDMSKMVQSEVSAVLSDYARSNGVSDEFVREHAKRLTKDIMNDPAVRNQVHQNLAKLTQNADDVNIQRQVAQSLASAISNKGKEIMNKEWKGEVRNEEKFIVPYSARRMVNEAGMFGPMRQLSVNVGFIDGDDEDYVKITKDNRTLLINPATREAWLDQGTRRVHLGAISKWTDDGIKKLVQRYLGDVADYSLRKILTDLRVMHEGITTTKKIATVPIGMATEPINPGLGGDRRRKRLGQRASTIY